MSDSRYRVILAAAVFSVVGLLFVACGGGGGSEGSAAPGIEGDSSVAAVGTGTVAIALTDGPADAFAEVNVTIAKVELLSDKGQVTVYEGLRTFNLLALTDESRLFAIRNGVPAGSYSKIRLTLTRIELVKRDANGNIVETAYPKLPGSGKLDLQPRNSFLVAANETQMLQIDVDVDASIHITDTGSDKYQFRPVAFVAALSEAPLAKLVRLHGVIEDIDVTTEEFKLCDTQIPVRVQEDKEDLTSRSCIQVAVADDTSIFGVDGQPTSFTELVAGEAMTIYGRIRRQDHNGDRVGGVAKGGNGNNSDKGNNGKSGNNSDNSNSGNNSDNGSSSNNNPEDGQYVRELHDLVLVAAVIEMGEKGTFWRLHGVAQSGLDAANLFTLGTRSSLVEALEPAPGAVWNFDTGAQGWSISGQVIHNPVGTLTVTHHMQYVEYYSPVLAGLEAEFDGGMDPYVQVRLRKLAGTITNWEGYMYWTTADHSWSDSYRNDIALPAALEAGEWVTLTWNMHNPTFGGDDWKNNTIKQIRFDLTPDIGPVFEIDSVVIGRRNSEVVVQVQSNTQIVDRSGAILNVSDIEAGVPLMVDGVLDMNVNPQILYAALVVIDSNAAQTGKLSGTLGAIPDGSCGLGLKTASGDRSISYDAYTRAYLVSGSGSQQISVETLPEGFSADVYGMEDIDGCFDAETIVAFE
ncbi:MAG: DUF4382 domain-containing protein [Thiogranum sp.]